MKTFRNIIIILLLGIFSLSLYKPKIITPEEEDLLTRLISSLENLYTSFPQQKVYLHFDKSEYSAGENIWFKAYQLNGNNHNPDTLSKIVYVDLIDPRGDVIQSKVLKTKDGYSYSDFFLDKTTAEGLYMVRAYTNWMRNFDQAFFFRKILEIKNPNPFLSSPPLEFQSKSGPEIDLQFFPEGGTLINGLKSKIAFKAVSRAGIGADIEGTVFDQKGNEVIDFSSSHLGMGVLYLTPEKGNNYFAVIKSDPLVEYLLPGANKYGYSLEIKEKDSGKIVVLVKARPRKQITNNITLIGQVRGVIYYNSKQSFSSDSIIIEIPEDNFPSGIVHLTLFDELEKPHNERLCFVNHKRDLQVQLNTKKKVYNPGDSIVMDISVSDYYGNPVSANLSLSVNNNLEYEKSYINNDNIYTNLLLTSDLRGNIEQPGYYFIDDKEERIIHLDYLLLTQGWRKFIWKDLLENKLPEENFQNENGISIAGKVLNHKFTPAKNINVKLTVNPGKSNLNSDGNKNENNNYKYALGGKTNVSGQFNFENLVLYDTSRIVIQANDPDREGNLYIQVNSSNSPDVYFIPLSEPENDFKKQTKKTRIKPKNYSVYKNKKQKDDRYPSYYNREEQERSQSPYAKYSNILTALRAEFPGVVVSETNILIRSRSMTNTLVKPLLYLDDMPVNVETLNRTDPRTIASIDVLKGSTSTLMYGNRGANGVINFYSNNLSPLTSLQRGNPLKVNILGYSTAREFYSPKYNPAKNNSAVKNKPATIYWSPVLLSGPDGKMQISFICPEGTLEFSTKLEGISDSGQILTDFSVFQINK